eukprot:TRINITY_DN14601_c0_g2_i1.p1 TRINITY_DN14601_c0_g2~~TRINITY_DN14601_c0_g2_i1.p1  ORF type:complete len:810 (+),score=93.27 TRINITY_DN14601_c0_g2_i1:57-2432(+)
MAASAAWATQASVDQSNCWIRGRSFEHCCVPWRGPSNRTSHRDCWSRGYTYESCCPPVPGRPPRDFFLCGDRHDRWRKFRLNMILQRNFAEADVSGMIKRDPRECLLGALVAALAYLFMAATFKPGKNASEFEYLRADRLLGVVLRSPMTFDEIFASGWPIGTFLANLRTLPAIRERSLRVFGKPPDLTADETRVAATISDAIINWRRVPADVGVLCFIEDQQPCVGGLQTIRTAAFAASVAWATSYTLRTFDAPRAPPQEQALMLANASSLLRLGEDKLRPALLQRIARTRTVSALSQVLAMQGPLLDVMQALQFPAVVEVDPLDLIRQTSTNVGLPLALRPPKANVLRPGFTPPLLQLHILPHDDAVSNMVRATRLPFCCERVYLFVVAAMIRAAACKDVSIGRVGSFAASVASGATVGGATADVDVAPDGVGAFCRQLASIHDLDGGTRGGAGSRRYVRRRLRLWEVGANLGDCMLWAVDMLSGRPTGSSSVAAKLEAIAVEPVPISASAMRRSAEKLSSRLREEAQTSRHGAPEVSLTVHEAALGDSVGTRNIGVPRSSNAEATFHDCQHHYGTFKGGPGCDFVPVATDSVDHILLGGLDSRGDEGSGSITPASVLCSEKNESTSSVVDLLKLHVQGSELSVLRGAKQSLANGHICVLILRLGSLGLVVNDKNDRKSGTPIHVLNARLDEVARETMQLLQGYRLSVVARNGTSSERIGGGSVARALARYLRLSARLDTLPNWSQWDENGLPMPHPWDRRLVAWHEGPCCRKSIAVIAARGLFGQRFA